MTDPMQTALRALPSVDQLVQRIPGEEVVRLSHPVVVDVVRDVLRAVRVQILQGQIPQNLSEYLFSCLAERLASVERALLGPVINATGVVLHTNLGRAPLSESALASICQVASGYSNLEYEVEAGERGSRHEHGERLLRRLTGAESTLVVNNNAAAVLLLLSTLPRGGEVIISRGELIEIGGAFRIPDVMEQSGCVLREVGTTNRTRLADYEIAFSERTVAVMKVHTSNYKLIGFTESVTGAQLSAFAKAKNVPFFEDLGSGVLLPTESFGLSHEPTVQEALQAGADVVTISGDKLLGGPQAGMILGAKEWIVRCRRHPLARAVRPGKLTVAALQATLLEYLHGSAKQAIPIWRMMGLSAAEVGERALALARQLENQVPTAQVEVVPGRSSVGGGSLPGETLPTQLLSIRRPDRSADDLAKRLRGARPPVIGRIEEGAVLLDLRTVDPRDDSRVLGALVRALAG